MNEKKELKIEKQKYTSPRLEVILVEMEQCISAGSATVSPTDDAEGDISAGWTSSEDQETTPF
ncbi:hypothetical protein CMT84_05625 [Elizabethkingia anophelis]|nr:hypothetical protein [Elizabethkingia anophelis]